MSEKAELTVAHQKLHQAYQEGRLIFVKSEKQEEQISKLIEDNKVANKTIVELKADLISGASENFKQQFQQQTNQQAAVESLEARVEELSGLVKTLTSQKDALQLKNDVLMKELVAIKESSTMILEASKDQNKKDLEQILRERKRASEYENAAAAKILKLEEEVASLQEALTDQAQDAETQAEMTRFMKAQRARGELAEEFQTHTDEEDEDEAGILEGERPFEQDEGAVYEAEEEAADEEDNGNPSLARGDPKQFFPTVKPKAKPTIPSGKGKLPRGDHGLTFPNGKLVDEKIDFNQWPSITSFRAWKLFCKKKVAAASRYSQEAFAWITEVEHALAFEDLEDSGLEAWQNQLDAKLSAELDKI